MLLPDEARHPQDGRARTDCVLGPEGGRGKQWSRRCALVLRLYTGQPRRRRGGPSKLVRYATAGVQLFCFVLFVACVCVSRGLQAPSLGEEWHLALTLSIQPLKNIIAPRIFRQSFLSYHHQSSAWAPLKDIIQDIRYRKTKFIKSSRLNVFFFYIP